MHFELNRKFYRKILSAAEAYGVNVLTENFTQMHHESGVYWMDSAKDIRELVEFVDHPLFHVCWDVGHANTTRIPQDESLRILGQHVYALHIQDNTGIEHPVYGYPDSHIAPYSGTNAKAKANATQKIPLLPENATNKRWSENYKEKHNTACTQYPACRNVRYNI